MLKAIPELLSGQSNTNLILTTIAATALAVWCGYRAYSRYHYAHTIQNIPTAKARSAHQGYVELVGNAQELEGEATLSPVSGTRCIWYRYRVDKRTQRTINGRTEQTWQRYDTGTSDCSVFWLKDDSGRVLVDPDGAAISTDRKFVWYVNHMSIANGGGLVGFIEGVATTRLAGARYRVTEERIHDRDPIYAIGLLKHAQGHFAAPTLNDDVRQKLADWKLDQSGLLERFDLDDNGELDMQEWELARAEARREVKRERMTRELNTDNELNILQNPDDKRRPFIVSTHAQHRLITKLKQQAALFAGAFFALGSTATYVAGFVQ